jgi:hypothetical protein
MGFAQLYYTSCERGLSGFAGFQFNAVTPGLAPELLRVIESLTAYKPPRWVSPRPTAAEITGAPVNLVYTTQPGTIVARVVFAGTDFSQRSGNYFAHALVGQEGATLGEILPIELWESPVWASKPISGNELAALPAVPGPATDAPLSRREVGRFIRDTGRPELLAALLTAAEDAILRDGRPIVIVDPDTTVTAHWIAAVSYLLPRPLARRLSFATYHHNPAYIDVHVIGTVPESDFGLTEMAFRSYIVLEPGAAHLDDVVAGPAAALLVRAGPSQAAVLWDRASGIAAGPGEALEDWHPALTMAALLGGPEVTIADLDALAVWLLRHADHVAPDQRAAVLGALVQDPAVRPRHLAALSALSHLVADHELTTRIERMAVTDELGRAGSGASEDFSTSVPIVTTEGKAFAVAECATQLDRASAEMAIGLLAWCTDLGLELPTENLRRCGRQVLGPRLATAPDDDTLGVVAGARALADGVLAYLATIVAEQPDAVAVVFTMGLDDITQRFPGLVPDELRESALVARAAKHPRDRVSDLQLFLTRHGRLLKPGLLGRMWPEGHWTAAEAQLVASAFTDNQLLSEPIYGWLMQAVESPPPDPGYLVPYAQLCEILANRGLERLLSPAATRQLDLLLGTKRLIEQARSQQGKAQVKAIQRLAGSFAQLGQPAQDLAGDALLSLIDELASSRHLLTAMEGWPAPVISLYLRSAHQRLTGTPRDLAAAARLFTTLASLSGNGDEVLVPRLDQVLGEELKLWRRGDLNGVEELLREWSVEGADQFAAWRQRRLSTGLRRSWRRLLTGHAEGGP